MDGDGPKTNFGILFGYPQDTSFTREGTLVELFDWLQYTIL
jgi:hypothetical protein